MIWSSLAAAGMLNNPSKSSSRDAKSTSCSCAVSVAALGDRDRDRERKNLWNMARASTTLQNEIGFA